MQHEWRDKSFFSKLPYFEDLGAVPEVEVSPRIELPNASLSESKGSEGAAADDGWMEGLSAAEVLRQFGVHSDAVLTPER